MAVIVLAGWLIKCIVEAWQLCWLVSVEVQAWLFRKGLLAWLHTVGGGGECSMACHCASWVAGWLVWGEVEA
jgi:hypothetical protein